MRINHNIAALNTHRQLNSASAAQGRSMEKLSSGLRINKAGDDAAGLAISEKMRSQIRGLDMASRNAQDGISMIQTAEGALNETHDILQRMRELAVQSANDTNTDSDRGEIQKEMNQLTSEINRIGNTTEFNLQKLLKGKDAPVTTTAVDNKTITAGVAGAVTGGISSLTTNAKSVVGVQSTTTVQASTSAATGAVSKTTVGTTSEKGIKASATMANGVKFEAADNGTAVNDRTIKIEQSTTAGTASSVAWDASSKTYTFTIGTNSDNSTLASNRGELYNQLKSAMDNAAAGPTKTAVDELVLAVPTNTDEAVTDVAATGTIAGGKAQTAGVYSFNVTDAFEEAGDTIKIGDQTFTAVLGPADATKGQFRVDNDVTLAATNDFHAGAKAGAGVTKYSDTTVITAAAAGDAGKSATMSFNGVEVTINITGTGGSSFNAGTNTLTLDFSADTTATLQGDKIAAAFNTLKTSGTDSQKAALADFTITNAAGTLKFEVTDPNNADKYNGNTAAQISTTATGGPTLAFSAIAETQGVAASLNAATNVVINIDGTDYTTTAAGNTAFNTALDGSLADTDIQTFIATAKDSNGNLLTDVATVSFDGNKLNIHSKANSSDSSVTLKIDDKSAGSDKVVLERALGVTSGSTVSKASLQADSLRAAIDANAVLSDRFTAAGGTGTTIQLTEDVGKATGVELGNPVVSGSGTNDKLTITNTDGINLNTITIKQAQTQTGAASKTDAVDTFDLEAGANGTELNGVKVVFGTLTNAATDLTSAWDADSKTLTVNGSLLDSANAATNSTAVADAIRAGLKTAGFSEAATTFNVTNATTGDSGDFSGKTIEFGKGQEGKTAIANNDTLTVEQNNGELTIYLATETASKNSADKIQAAVQALGKTQYSNGIDFSKLNFEAEGNWDTKTLGNSIVKASGTFVGGTEEVKGSYSFDISKEFAAGDKLEILGQVLKAVESGAKASEGQFNASGNTVAQAAGIIDALNLNSAFKDKYTASVSGSKITITEKVADGVDMKASDLDVRSTGTQGEYAINVDEVLENGATFTLDGQDITVSNKETNVGYANGTAIKEVATAKDQATALANAINSNDSLKNKYTASVNAAGELVLKQTEDFTTDKAPEVATKNSPLGKFEASFQVGANAGQSMTIEVEDMRATALGISGNGSESNVAAKDGKVASYVATASVSDGTSNTNSEFALDVSSSEKASAAISVINDAIEKVSAQRSQLGAFQNRLDHTINNLNASSENLTAAESRIRDVDMAKEMMTQTKNSILAQAAQAMLAQANQQPQGVLQLLR